MHHHLLLLLLFAGAQLLSKLSWFVNTLRGVPLPFRVVGECKHLLPANPCWFTGL
jgi:hypothetical protein